MHSFGVIDPHLAARIFLHISKGVAASHHAGVVHRDLKPSNIIVENGVNLHELKITDFGIATLTEEVFEEAAREGDLTRSTSGTIRGALPYMAPEMMFRKAGEYPGKSADIWSLGAMMFQLLTGKVPFGVYLQAAVNVQNQNREPWPAFMTSKPSADELVEEISNLCFIGVDRQLGTVSRLIQNGYSGFVEGDDLVTTFFSMESVYGNKRPSVGSNNRVCYAQFPGSPRHRGHPIIVVS